MAYCFGIDHSDQTLFHEPEFKKKLDAAVAQARSVVYVGWRPDDSGYKFFDWLKSQGERLTILVEAWAQNVAAFKPPYRTCFKVRGDILIFDQLVPDWARDCLVWQDGPEHLANSAAVPLIKRMQRSFNSIVLATPDGPLPQGPVNGNPYERHVGAWTKELYRELGFEVVSYSAGLIGLWQRQPSHDDITAKASCGPQASGEGQWGKLAGTLRRALPVHSSDRR